MIFAPVRLGETSIAEEVLAADKKSCKRFGPCGVGDEAVYLNSFFFDRVYYAALKSVKRIFKRVAMSKGGFSGKGVFGAIPYLVVELDDGTVKQCNFKYEQDVDLLLAHISKICPDLPTHSVEAEKRLREKQAAMEAKFLKELTPKAQKAREELEGAKAFLESYPEQTAQLSVTARRKRGSDRTRPAYRWVALAIIVGGLICGAYGIYELINHDTTGLYFTLLGLAAAFLFSGTQVIPTAKNNKKAVTAAWQESIAEMEKILPEDFPVPARYAHPIVLERMIRVLREGRAQSVKESLAVVKEDLKKLNADVQVEQEEYDEVVTIKPMFLLQEYK